MNLNNPMHQQFEAKLQAMDKKERTLTCVIVSNQTNRGKRKVDIKGCSYDDYMKSPVVLAFHDDERVIAKCQWLKFTDEGIVAKFEFREGNELADDIYELYKGGYLTSWSIGFLPVSWNYEEEDGQEIIHITKWVLLEVSAVSIPMDANAITLAIGQGLIHDERLIQSVKNSVEGANINNLLEQSCNMQNSIDMLRHDIKFQSEEFQSKLSALQTIIEELKQDTHDQGADSINIIDFSDFSKEIHKQIRSHVNHIKGKVS